MLSYEDIVKVSSKLPTIDQKGKPYVQVNDRIKAFKELYPEGTIITEILDVNWDIGVVLMKATVMDEEGHVFGTGHAYERENVGYVNKTSMIENCETSAIGRAIGNGLALGIDGGVASYEEVSQAIEAQESLATDREKAAYIELCKKLGENHTEILKRTGWKSGPMTKEQHGKALIILKEIEEARAESEG